MAKLTLEERRLQTLRAQLQGKPHAIHRSDIKPARNRSDEARVSIPTSPEYPSLGNETGALTNDLYLKKDLLRILILSTLAIALQICLYFLKLNHVLKFF